MKLDLLESMRTGILCLLVLILMMPTVDAGVGIVYGAEYFNVNEENTNCVTYGIYNPWNDNATVKVSARGKFANFTVDSEPVDIPSRTKHQNAVPVEICFDIPKTYEEECLFWKIGCKRVCGEEIEYKGEVVASEITGFTTAGTGSRVTGAVTAPLTLRVKCQDTTRDLISIIGLMGVIIFAILSALVWNHHREPISVRRMKKAKKLEKKKERLERKLKKI